MLSTPPYQWLFYDPGHELQDLLLSFHDIAVNFTVLSILLFDSRSPRSDVSHLDHAYFTDAVNLVTSAYETAKNASDDVSATNAYDFRDEVNRIMREVRRREF
jgi:hypothetical protein